MLSEAASVATAVGVFLAVIGLRQTQRQRVRQFEDFYVGRYWTLLDSLSPGIVTGTDGKLVPEDQKVIHAYLVLCEDELDLRAEGWISDATWKLWSKGIQSQLARGPFRRAWEQTKGRLTTAGPQFQRLRNFEQDFEDPLPHNFRWWWKRRWRGLHGWLTQ